jgi:segregation and condensation protein A
MSRDFQKVNIPRLPVFTTEEGIKRIKEFFGKLNDWKNINELLPINFTESKNSKRTGKAGIFSGSLELAKEGSISIKQKNLFDDIFIKENK